MFVSQLLQTVLGGAMSAGGRSLRQRARDLGWLLAVAVLGGWCLMVGLLALGAAAWLAMAPRIGAAAATALVGLLFLVLGGLLFWAYRRRRDMKRVAKRLDTVSPGPDDLQQQILHSINANIGPLLTAAVAAFLVSRVTRRD